MLTTKITLSLLLSIASIIYYVNSDLTTPGVYYITNEWSGKSIDCLSHPILTQTNKTQVFDITYIKPWDGGEKVYQVECLIRKGRCLDYSWTDKQIGSAVCDSNNGDQHYAFLKQSETNRYRIVLTPWTQYLEMTGTNDDDKLSATSQLGNHPSQYFQVIQGTNYPTADPTGTPTQSTIYPTTGLPTSTPTTATVQPTTQQPISCEDYEFMNNNNVTVNSAEFLNNFKAAHNSKHYINTDLVQCDITNGDICYVECKEHESCKNSQIIVENKNLSALTVECTGKSSCNNVYIDVSDSEIGAVVVLCGSELSCHEMQLDIYVRFLTQISIYCNDQYSCDKLWVNLKSGPVTAKIICADDYSCNDLVVIGNKQSHDIKINLLVHRFSDNIFVKYPYLRNINVQCTSFDDQKYIKYNTDKLLRQSELLQLARSTYATNVLPCESIKLECSKDKSCDFAYNTDNFDVIDILIAKQYSDCRLLNIANIFDAECEGNCMEELDTLGETYIRSVLLDVDVVFTNLTDADLKKLCAAHFDTNPDRDSSLQSINIIFDHILLELINDKNTYPDYSVVIEIINGSNALLRDAESLHCDTKIYNPLKLRNNLVLSSVNNNTAVIDALFVDESLFTLKSCEAIERYFALPIGSIVIHTTIDNDSKMSSKYRELLWFVIIVCFSFFCIIMIIMWKLKQKQKEREKGTIYIRNPMVIAIAIGIYDQNPTDPDSDFEDYEFTNLLAIDKDIISVINTFKIPLQYTLYPDYDHVSKQIKQYWTKAEMSQFLSKKASHLEKGKQDGLVVVISAHGVENSVVCSDIKKVDKEDIHRIFTADHPSVRKLPRIFIYDCCNGEQKKDDRHRSEINNEKNENIQAKSGVQKSEQKVSLSNHNSILWASDEDNPDYKLAKINSSNLNFQGFLNSKIGSLCIYELLNKISENISNNNEKFLSEITSEVQKSLYPKQLITTMWNNGTDKIKFQKNTVTNECPLTPTQEDDVETDKQLEIWAEGNMSQSSIKFKIQ